MAIETGTDKNAIGVVKHHKAGDLMTHKYRGSIVALFDK